MRMTILPIVLLMTTACGDADQVPGGVSADEAAALNDAAAMLDANSVSVNAIDAQEDEAK